MQPLTVSRARAELPRIIEAVQDGEEVVLTRHGVEVAVVVRPDLLRLRRRTPSVVAAEQVARDLVDAAARPLPSRGAVSEEFAQAMIARIRADRAAR